MISANHVIAWWNILNKKYVHMRIKQKIPTKMFLGINISDTHTDIIINNVTYFNQYESEFQTKSWQEVLCLNVYKLQKIIKKKLLEFWYIKWLEINVLSENENDHGTDFCGLLAVLFAFLTYLISSKTDLKLINAPDEFRMSSAFKDIYTLAEEMLQELWIDSIWTTAFATMITSEFPVIWMLENKTLKNDIKGKASLKNNISMFDYFNLKNEIDYPKMDYGIVHFRPFCANICIDESYNTIKTTYATPLPFIDIANDLYTQLLKIWKNILSHPGDEKYSDDFIDTIQNNGLFTAFIEKDKQAFVDMLFLFEKNKQFVNEKIWLMPISNMKLWSNFSFFSHYQRSREMILKLIWSLRELGHKKAQYSYLSWIDGYSHDAVKVEQDIERNFYSEYIKKDSTLLECCDGTKIINNYAGLLKNLPQGIVLDTVSGKVFVNGIQATHKDLFTQSWTVEIFDILLQHIGKTVNNADLPSSSYSKSKNDMTGKILLPLQQLAKKHFNQKLDITCTGNIVDFDLILNKCSLPLSIIRRMM